MIKKIVKFASKGFIPFMIWVSLNMPKLKEMLKDGELDAKEQAELEQQLTPYFGESTDEMIMGLALLVSAIDYIKAGIKAIKKLV